jgi:hypothetical protein
MLVLGAGAAARAELKAAITTIEATQAIWRLVIDDFIDMPLPL